MNSSATIYASNAQVTSNVTASSVKATGSLVLPFIVGDVACNRVGEMKIDSSDNQVVWCDGLSREIVIPAIHILQGTFDLTSWYDVDDEVWLMDLHQDRYASGITITAWYMDCSVADPTTELDAWLKFADNVGGNAFPGGNIATIDQINTITGNTSNTVMSSMVLGNGKIPPDKTIYIKLDADPADANTLWHFRMHYYINED